MISLLIGDYGVAPEDFKEFLAEYMAQEFGDLSEDSKMQFLQDLKDLHAAINVEQVTAIEKEYGFPSQDN